jgi:hypothetical protein
MPHHYQLFRGDVLLGTIDHSEDDFPWHVGTIDPSPAFEAVEALFAREAELLAQSSESREWRIARDEIDAPGLRLVGLGGRTLAANPLLHIREQRVWWR